MTDAKQWPEQGERKSFVMMWTAQAKLIPCHVEFQVYKDHSVLSLNKSRHLDFWEAKLDQQSVCNCEKNRCIQIWVCVSKANSGTLIRNEEHGCAYI